MATTKGEGPTTTILNDTDFLAAAGGQIDFTEGPRPRAPQKQGPPRKGDYAAPPEEAVLTPTAPLAGSPDQEAPELRVGHYDTVPTPEAQQAKSASRNQAQIVVEIDHSFEHRTRQVIPTYHVVTPDPKNRVPVGTGFQHGIPLTVFGVPAETGRRYIVTVTESPDSMPSPKRNPFEQGSHV